MRVALMAVFLLGCDVLTPHVREVPPTPVVPPAVGQQVEQRWQFRNLCPYPVSVNVWRVNGYAGDTGEISVDTLSVIPTRCYGGETVCFGAWSEKHEQTWGSGITSDVTDAWCAPCSGGWLAARNLECE